MDLYSKLEIFVRISTVSVFQLEYSMSRTESQFYLKLGNRNVNLPYLLFSMHII